MPKTTKKTKRYAADSDFVRNLEQDITAFIKAGRDQAGTEERFNELALRLFECHFNTIPVYQKYCKKRGGSPSDIKSWEDIPAVPATAFKEIPLCTFPPEQAVKVFTSSGTTDQTKRSTMYFDEAGLRLLELSQQTVVTETMCRDFDKARLLLAAPPPTMAPNLALTNYPLLALKGRLIGEPVYLIGKEGLDLPGLVANLREAEDPLILTGATFAFLHFFEYSKSQNMSFRLPEKSVINDGGGFKGQAREIPREEYFELARQVLGIPPERILNAYGLSEVATGFNDNGLYNKTNGIDGPRYKMIPHWVKAVVVDPDTLKPLPKGQTGLLRYHCLTNFSNVMAVQSDDLGYAVEDGFEVVGRAKGAEARGCSIAMDELISAQKMK